jgi:serine/threonine protein kinase/tetratricopeptide (TPR) repeat protein
MKQPGHGESAASRDRDDATSITVAVERADVGDTTSATRDDGRAEALPTPPAAIAVGTGAPESGAGSTLQPQPGLRIQQYELLRQLGAGGMGTVYLARDTKLGRRVAIKFLQANHPDLTQRFLIEARATARCRHDNIVVIHEVDEHLGQPYMVLEFLEGKPLTQLLGTRQALPYPRAVEIVVPVLRALVVAHEQGIVHRDLKPENILVTDGGAIKVLDFGIAKVAQGAGPHAAAVSQLIPVTSPDAVTGNTELTRHGTTVGTARYMSPEQWRDGGDVDLRTDIWAAGILLFRMLAGRHPLSPGDGELRLSVGALDRPMPSLRDAAPDVPAELAAIVDRCLRKRKEERWPSARELLAVLEPFAISPPAPTPRPRRDARPWLAMGVVAAAAGGFLWTRSAPAPTIAARPPVGVAETEPAAPVVTRRPPPTGTPYERGLEHLRRWEGAAARAALDEAVTAAPDDAPVRLARCKALNLVRDAKQALAEAQRGLAAVGLSAGARRSLEACRHTAAYDHAGAAALYREAFSEDPDPESGVDLATSQSLARDSTGLESTLAALRARADGEPDARLIFLDGEARFLLGDYHGASERWQRAAAHAAGEGLPVIEAIALDRGGEALRIRGELRAASDNVERARRLYLEAGEELHLAEVLTLQGDLLYDLGELRAAIPANESAAAIFRRAGNHKAMLNNLSSVAQMRFLTGDHAAGRRGLDEVVRLAAELRVRRIGDDYIAGWERLHAGDARAARRLVEASRRAMTEGAAPYWIAYFEWTSGEIALLAGDLATARKALERATAVASGANFLTSASCTRVLLAATALAEGKAAEAEALSRHAVGELDRMGVRDCRTRGRAVLARALHAQDKRDATHAVLAEAAAIAPATEDVWIRWDLAVAHAEDEIARGEVDAARDRLRGVLAEAHGHDLDDAALAAAVLLGTLERRAPATARHGEARLAAAADRARALGQAPVAERARAALAAR